MLAQEKKTKAFLAIYEPFVRKHTVKLKDNLEEIVDFSKGQGCTVTFFRCTTNYFTSVRICRTIDWHQMQWLCMDKGQQTDVESVCCPVQFILA